MNKKCDTGLSFLKNCKNFIKGPYGVFCGGIVLVIGGVIWQSLIKAAEQNVQNTIANIVISIGGVLFVSGILSNLFTIDFITNKITEILKGVLIDKDYIKDVKDKRGLWEKVTKLLVEERFIQIHDELFDVIVNKYLPTNENNIKYYEDHISTHEYKWKDKDNLILNLSQKIDFILHAEDEGECTYSQRHWNVSDVANKIISFEVSVTGGQKIDEGENTINDREIEKFVTMKGSDKYHVCIKINKELDLKKDNGCMFRAKYITKRCVLRISYPNDLLLDFTGSGSCEVFSEEKLENLTIYENKNLILPCQGFVYYFTPNFDKHSYNYFRDGFKQQILLHNKKPRTPKKR